MLEPYHVSQPTGQEELRLWAEAIADLHNVVELLAEHAPLLLPGEHVEEFRAAWGRSRTSFVTVIQALDPGHKPAPKQEKFKIEHLQQAQLNGENGALKRSVLRQLRDAFLGYFVPEPRSEEKLRLAARAGARHADMGAVSLDSLGAAVSEVPLLGFACKAAEETLLVGKHLLELRDQRR